MNGSSLTFVESSSPEITVFYGGAHPRLGGVCRNHGRSTRSDWPQRNAGTPSTGPGGVVGNADFEEDSRLEARASDLCRGPGVCIGREPKILAKGGRPLHRGGAHAKRSGGGWRGPIPDRAVLAYQGQPRGERKAICALVSSEKYGRYLTDIKRGLPKIDYGKVQEEEKLDGRYLLRTSDDTLSAEDVVLGYKQLIEVEEAFRTLKSTLDIRPVYHRLDDRIRAHVMLSWLALLLVRVAEARAKDTWRNIRRELQRMHLTQLKLPGALATRRTETTAMQAQIFKLLGVKEPPKVWDISPAEPEARIS